MSESIEELRQRWEEDPSPQLSMQLAEEYRRQNLRADAAGVLTRALEENPEHVAARVALGRFKSELGEVEEACDLLERVVTEDPTHLVASKLLVSLYLERGDERQARDRLDLYKLLNESDPEIEVLEARLSGSSRGPEAASIVVDIPRNGDPFQDLWAGVDSAAYWQAFGAEGIFPVSGKHSPPARQDTAEIQVAQEEEVAGATVTLANLYLQQGHLEDAEMAFGEVLSREPANPEALAGMEEIGLQRSESLAAIEIPAAAAPAVDDSASRKIEVLRDYLRQIRTTGNQK